MKRAYIYARTSTERQQQADRQSIDSQLAQAKEFLKSHPDYELQDTIIDATSAYSGSHLDAGLGTFLKDAEKGLHVDSMLIVVYTDRLTRLTIDDAFALLKRLAVAKVNLAITSLGALIRYNDPLEFGLRMTLTSLFHIAHTDSKIKSDRVRKAFVTRAEKIRDGQKILKTTGIPAWITIVDGDYHLDAEKAATIQFIFELKVKGLGGNRIAQALAEENIATFTPTFWTRSYIDKILRSVSTYGAYQVTGLETETNKDGKLVRKTKLYGEPIEGYYPAAITKELFEAAQYTIAKTPKGRVSPVNPFRGLLRCYQCGRNMSVSASPSGVYYVRCNSRKEPLNDTCKAKGVKLDTIKQRILLAIGKITLPVLDAAKPDSQALKEKIRKLERAIKRNNETIDFEDDDGLVAEARTKVRTFTKELREYEKELYRVTSATPNLTAYNPDKNPEEFNTALLEVFEYIAIDKRYTSFQLRGYYGNDWEPALVDWDAGEGVGAITDYLDFMQTISNHQKM